MSSCSSFPFLYRSLTTRTNAGCDWEPKVIGVTSLDEPTEEEDGEACEVFGRGTLPPPPTCFCSVVCAALADIT